MQNSYKKQFDRNKGQFIGYLNFFDMRHGTSGNFAVKLLVTQFLKDKEKNRSINFEFYGNLEDEDKSKETILDRVKKGDLICVEYYLDSFDWKIRDTGITLKNRITAKGISVTKVMWSDTANDYVEVVE